MRSLRGRGALVLVVAALGASRARADGLELDRMSLGILPDGGLLQLGKQVLVSAGRGTIRPVTATLRTSSAQ